MQDRLNKELEKIYTDFTLMYNITKEELKSLIAIALGKAYNSKYPATILDNHTLLIIVESKGHIDTKTVILSQEKTQIFYKHLVKSIEQKEIIYIKEKLLKLVKENNYIISGQAVSIQENHIIFQLHTKEKRKLDNCFAIISNEDLLPIDYANSNKLHLLQLPNKFFPRYEKGKYYVNARNKKHKILEIIINSSLKKIRLNIISTVYTYSKLTVSHSSKLCILYLNQYHISKEVTNILGELVFKKSGYFVKCITKHLDN